METPDPTPAFTAFGKTLTKIAAIEQIMRLALSENMAVKLAKNGAIDAAAKQKFINRLLRYDLGQLFQIMKDRFSLPNDPWLAYIKDAKGIRNNFAHQFWTPHYSNIRTARGIDIICRICSGAERHFDYLAAEIIDATGVDIEGYISFVLHNPDDEQVYLGWEKLIAEQEEALAELDQLRCKLGS